MMKITGWLMTVYSIIQVILTHPKLLIWSKQKVISVLFLFIQRRYQYFTILSNFLGSESCFATALRVATWIDGQLTIYPCGLTVQ